MRRLPTILKNAEIDSLLLEARNAADIARTPIKQFCAWRDVVMIQTGLFAGPRVAELCNLKVENIDLAGAVLSILGGKGDKDRNVPIGNKLMTALREWIGEREEGWLFPGPKGKKLSTRTFQLRLDALAKKASIRKSVHPHLMRHCFATNLLRTGADIVEIQQMLGHANLATTAIYLHCAPDRLKPAVDRL